MDDRYAQFLFVVADACSAAALGELTVEILTSADDRYCGVPTAVEIEQPDASDGGTLRIAGTAVALEDVVEFLVRSPGEAASPTLN